MSNITEELREFAEMLPNSTQRSELTSIATLIDIRYKEALDEARNDEGFGYADD